ncbi:lactate racemase domain-containing protein [Thalassoglobus sp. JC818]|uniref:lactate racemase domain-containing protein n=1 Tax=Thalassoglobus sp. JC818 TaxID=3232136 RepID=UPI003459FDC2
MTSVPQLTEDEVRSWFESELPIEDFSGKKVLLIVPDATRTAPMPLLFDCVHSKLSPHASRMDVIFALGTHQPMPETQMMSLLGMTAEDRSTKYRDVKLMNHHWDRDDALSTIGELSPEETEKISDGLLSMNVPIQINRCIHDYDILLVLGPVFPHEVVGFSGGNKYFFPGISGPKLLNFFHWLGALITNVGIIGVKKTPVREVVDLAATRIPVERRAITFVVASDGTTNLHGLFYGTPEDAWSRAADVSSLTHIKRLDKPFQTVLSCSPKMYDELWTAGKCMYKLEPVVADGGELIIYAPHLREISVTHDKTIREIGYHCRDYFIKQWDQFKHLPWGVLAHSTHVRGSGTFENGVENCRVKVTLASQVPPEECEAINLGYRNPDDINIEDYANREDEGVLLVRKAGEQLYRLAE